MAYQGRIWKPYINKARKVLPVGKNCRTVSVRVRRVFNGCDKAYRAARRIYRQISDPPWSTDTLAVEIAAKLKEDYEASPTT